MHQITLISLLAVLAISSGVGAAEVAIAKVPPRHPRVYLQADDLPALRQKIAMDEFKPAYAEVKAAIADRRIGPFCAAFVYLIEGDKAVGRRAVEEGLVAMRASNDGRTPAMPMHWCACVYDWCYDLLSDQEKQQFITEFKRISASHEPFYPAKLDSHAIVGHGTEGWLLTGQLPLGVAIYDEDKSMYDAAAALFFKEFVPARNFYYPGHAHHQGDSYGGRFLHDLCATWLFRRMGAGDVFTREQEFVPYQVIYNLRPDGRQFRSGDTFDESGKAGAKRLIQLLCGSYYDNPYEMWMADSDFFDRPGPFDRIFELLFRKPNATKRSISELPLAKYFAQPIGTMVVRTGWNMGKESPAPDAMVSMHMGEYFFGNHQRKDFGNFQIYYRGPLAISSGFYEGRNNLYGSDHWINYYHQTIAHNGLLIFDPAEKQMIQNKPAANDGGQHWPNGQLDHPVNLDMLFNQGYHVGKVLSHGIVPDPKRPLYSYISGDITAAYSKKVSLVTRSMVTLTGGDAKYPCTLIVLDHVIAADPSFKKTWLLHTMDEPTIEGGRISAVYDKNGYGGKLVAECLLPQGAAITKVGGPGKEFWVESTQINYAVNKPSGEGGAWRVEVSPPALGTPAKEDVFLHVLSVMDSTTADAPVVNRIDAPDVVGARIGDCAVLFARPGREPNSFTFNTDGPARLRYLICNLPAGQWTIQGGGQAQATTLTATEEGKSVFFEGPAGTYTAKINP